MIAWLDPECTVNMLSAMRLEIPGRNRLLQVWRIGTPLLVCFLDRIQLSVLPLIQRIIALYPLNFEKLVQLCFDFGTKPG